MTEVPSNPPTHDAASAEAQAVAQRYARRGPPNRYHPFNPDVMLTLQERERAMIALLRAAGIGSLAGRNVFEVGCGTGSNLLGFLRLGCEPGRLAGIELLAERHAAARRLLPDACQLFLGDAAQAPVAPGSQDIVFQGTVFSSLLDDAYQQRLADAMWRWTRPGGGVLWYDFTVNNPRNADVRGVPLRRVRELFPQGRFDVCRVTLAPPLARAVTRLHPSLYTAFNLLPFLRTHVLAWIGKPPSP